MNMGYIILVAYYVLYIFLYMHTCIYAFIFVHISMHGLHIYLLMYPRCIVSYFFKIYFIGVSLSYVRSVLPRMQVIVLFH